jgi:CpeT/CpcT family (DUF1001)
MKLLALLLALAPAPAFADAAQLADWWTGSFDNRAQVAANSAPGEPDVPELTRTARRMTIERLNMPALGPVVVLLNEYKAPVMGIANRSRVYVLMNLPDGRVRAVQHFFTDAPTYDRKPVTAAMATAMPPSAFRLFPGCDLFFTYNAKTGRYEGGMPPRTCIYEHATDGFVYAEFDQFVWPRAAWYRDRSVKIATGATRGSIDGFAYLRFNKQ